MGFEISFHPIPWGLLTQIVHPWLLGKTPESALESLTIDAVRLVQVRWLTEHYKRALYATPAAAALPILGRPYVVTGRDPGAIAEGIDRYLAARPSHVPALVREQVEPIAPGVVGQLPSPPRSALPSEDTIIAQVIAPIIAARRAIAAHRQGLSEWRDPGGTTHQISQVLGRPLTLTVLRFCAIFRPGWRSRGVRWPTLLLHNEDVDTSEWFVENTTLIMPIYKAFQDLPWVHAKSIYENNMVGGCAALRCIPMIQEALMVHVRPQTPDAQHNLMAMQEALADAWERELPFAEATECYPLLVDLHR